MIRAAAKLIWIKDLLYYTMYGRGSMQSKRRCMRDEQQLISVIDIPAPLLLSHSWICLLEIRRVDLEKNGTVRRQVEVSIYL